MPRLSHLRPTRLRRRTRVVIMAVLAPVALVSWQANAATGVQVTAQRTQGIEGSWVESRDLVENRSAVLGDFYESHAFDAYVDAWVAAQAETFGYADDCDTARSRVFLPPFTGWVDQACADLLGDGERTRLAAFLPVMIKFLRACRGVDTTARQPYSDAQWAALDKVIDRAVKTDCAKPEPGSSQAPLQV